MVDMAQKIGLREDIGDQLAEGRRALRRSSAIRSCLWAWKVGRSRRTIRAASKAWASATQPAIRRKTAELREQALKLARSGNLQHDVIGPLVTEVDHIESGVAELEQQLANIRNAPTASGWSVRAGW